MSTVFSLRSIFIIFSFFHSRVALDWQKESYAFIGHSYGALISTLVSFIDQWESIDVVFQYAAFFPEEVLCFIAIDALPRAEVPAEFYWKVHGSRVDARIQYQSEIEPKIFEKELTMEKILELWDEKNNTETNDNFLVL